MKLKNCILYVAVGLLLTACSSAPKMDSAEGFENVISTVTGKVDSKYEIIKVMAFERDKLTNELGMIIVSMYYEGKPYSLTITENVEPEIKEGKGSYNGDVNKIKGIDFAQLDKDKYRSYIEQAVEIFSEATGDVEYVYKGVASFTIGNNGKGEDVTYDIDINFTEKDASTKVQGRNIVTEYYTIEFRVDKDGNLKMVD